MNGWEFAAWGAFGGFIAVALDFVKFVGATRRLPWSGGRLRVDLSAYMSAAALRVVIGGGIAAAAGTSGYLTNSLLALAVGLGAPMVAGKLVELATTIFGASSLDGREASGGDPGRAKVAGKDVA